MSHSGDTGLTIVNIEVNVENINNWSTNKTW
jgi:hypothetical protein